MALQLKDFENKFSFRVKGQQKPIYDYTPIVWRDLTNKCGSITEDGEHIGTISYDKQPCLFYTKKINMIVTSPFNLSDYIKI